MLSLFWERFQQIMNVMQKNHSLTHYHTVEPDKNYEVVLVMQVVD